MGKAGIELLDMVLNYENIWGEVFKLVNNMYNLCTKKPVISGVITPLGVK